MKDEHRMGKGEFSYMRDWRGEEESENGKAPPYKQMILALIEDEVASQVSAKVDAALKQIDGKIAEAIKNMDGKTSVFMKDHAASSAASQERAVLLAKIEGLEQTVKMLQAKPQVVQTPQGKIVMQQAPRGPSSYSVQVERGADGLIKSLKVNT
jgi:hypothetical protein